MIYEKSCGAVVFTRVRGEIRYVIIQSLEGFYGFPKGHMEADETEEETALREIREEVGLTPALLPGFRVTDEHPLPGKPGVMKRIVYFLAEYHDQEPLYQREELLGAFLMDYETAMAAFQFESSRSILREAREFLQQ